MPPPVSFARGPARLPNANRKARGGWLGLGADPARHQPKRLMSHGGKGWRAALGPLRRHSTPLIALHDNPLVRWGETVPSNQRSVGLRKLPQWTPAITVDADHRVVGRALLHRRERHAADLTSRGASRPRRRPRPPVGSTRSRAGVSGGDSSPGGPARPGHPLAAVGPDGRRPVRPDRARRPVPAGESTRAGPVARRAAIGSTPPPSGRGTVAVGPGDERTPVTGRDRAGMRSATTVVPGANGRRCVACGGMWSASTTVVRRGVRSRSLAAVLWRHCFGVICRVLNT